ncbi:MAG: NapC/NirT family cytochrome c [Thermoanaerobaculia bacterium]
MSEATPAKKPSLARNLISSIGLLIAVLALINIAFLVFMDIGADHSNPYLGIFAYIVFPGVLCGGLALFVLGMLIERNRRRKHKPEEIPAYPRIDLNDGRTRKIAGWSIVAISVFLLVSMAGSYQAYHYAETDAFCGTTCHEIMHPEYTAYKASPHARVGCVNCHIGSGATWFVKSKLSGSYQVYATIMNKVPRPIESPVANLRPAQETCEQCHWPQKFWGAQLKVFNHFGFDEANTPRETQMLIKTGGGEAGKAVGGIHWHMNITNEISYIASDRKRQEIEWVRMRDRKTGRVTEYLKEGSKLTPQQIATMEKRTMDCVDCHNRPTHIYTPPDRAIDRAMLTNAIPRDLPYIKAKAVETVTKDYTSTQQAVDTIAKDINSYYQTDHPAVYQARKKEIDRAVAQLQEIFRTIRFPEMKVDWRTHPDNIGHLYSPGCFRCHNDQHVSKDGQRITKDCKVCHDILGQKEASRVMIEEPHNDFTHPVDLGDLREMNCSECHTGSSM